MKKLLIGFVVLFGAAVFAGPPGPGPHGPGPHGPGPHGPGPHHGSDGLRDAAAITSIVANGVRIAGELNRARQPAQTTTIVTTPAVPAQTTTIVTTPAVPAQTTIITR